MKTLKLASFLIIALFVLLSFRNISRSDSGKSVKSDSANFTIDNCVNTFSEDKTVKTAAGYQYWFVDKDFLDGRTIKLSVAAPHKATHAPHVHHEDEFFFVLEGKAEFYLNGKRKVVGPMTSLYCPSDIEHGIRNAGDTELKYLVIKKYDLD